ncbi:histone-binding protein N1/N2 isoform X1 [Oryzias melastigma]|uniref:Nuclear autoantigenic sperm protein n=1 Tax=Oryzias melastigma TaxID=30732 RepID=A0A3B3BUG5_ORYME|nr:histone-binding protein N1/N2 isoform X3 [Oryzias melastigma]XP_036072097.1 histone-binding protein N1/N2 isoform X1 [Oryzias melastigma]
MEEANKLIGAGKKFLVMGKAVEAVSALQEACGMLAKQYGDTADECGEAFLWCGKALLDLARMENSVLGNALEGVPEEDEDEDKPKDSNVESTEGIDEEARDELRVQVYDAMAEKKNEEEEKADKGQNEGGEEPAGQQPKADEGEEAKEDAGKEKSEEVKETDQEAAAEQEEESTPNEESEEAKPEEEGEEDEDEMEEQADGAAAEKDSEDEEVGNLQLAWEMLEVAKSIYKRKDAKEDQLMAAQAHLKLGEVSAESGNYTQALEDFQECLKLQVKHLEADSRLLAETHYQLGLTYSLNLQYSPAIEALNSSISVIKSRLEKLEELLKNAEGPEALPGERKEMEELKALLPEIQEKVEDATEGLKLVKATVGGEQQDGGALVNGGASSSSANGTLSNGSQTSAVPVSNISHLVRKKRKPEESPVKENDVKKAKQDQEPDAAASGDQNGHVNEMEVAK